MTLVYFLAGGVLLIAGAELLVRGASRLAAAAGVSPLVVGLTVVAFGTSSPELAVTVGAANSGNVDLALGNVLGSNVFNILFILGLSAIVAPLVVAHQIVRLDVPLMIAASLLVLIMAVDGAVSRGDGLLLIGSIVAYTVFLIRRGRRHPGRSHASADGGEPTQSAWAPNLVLILAGLGLLVLGSRWLVQAAVSTASRLGVSELVVGLTIVAVGTSLPELATSVLASVRGERDLAVGNVIGSNLFNLLGVLGLASVIAPGGVPVAPGALTFDIPVMIGVSIAALPIFFTGYRIARWEGAVFLVYWGGYTLYLVLDALAHPFVHRLGTAMLWFVLPLTLLTLSVLVARAPFAGRSSGDHGV